jgi:hypothetical protein
MKKFKVGDMVKSDLYDIWKGKNLYVVYASSNATYFCSLSNQLYPMHNEEGSLFFYGNELTAVDNPQDQSTPEPDYAALAAQHGIVITVTAGDLSVTFDGRATPAQKPE